MKASFKLTAIVCLGFLAGTARTASAGLTLGPFPDGYHVVNVGVNVTVTTSFNATFHIPFDGNYTISISDFASLTVTTQVPVVEFSYITINTIPATAFNPATDNVTLTDITALATGGPNDLLGTGFNPGNPEAVVNSETFVGLSSTNYLTTTTPVTLGNLGSTVPGFDTSGITGDPNSLVYVSQVTLPATEADINAVPEPWTVTGAGTAALFGSGCAWRRRRRRTA
jgi:hypothetical protein